METSQKWLHIEEFEEFAQQQKAVFILCFRICRLRDAAGFSSLIKIQRNVMCNFTSGSYTHSQKVRYTLLMNWEWAEVKVFALNVIARDEATGAL